ncbi:glycoside hydrolase domain-containing protein [Acrocarpospora catenulata]|uniref:glycoside hydrolase domain-containing protein n=1 Tax=Acrocarpospora catenulata TaxID=2836182 RepID=UPI0020239CDF|nr:glycoside hydrolase domain-containing protein [Acrocarpospora catenulata]
MVRRAQRFINTTYGNVPGINPVVEDGITGWSTVYALTRCLQHQLGITALADNFGPTTMATLQSAWPSINATSGAPANLVRIIQSGLYCKGYDGGEINGVYNARVEAAVTRLKADAGVGTLYPGPSMVPKLFKALLNMDPYLLIAGGNATVRAVQQWMNARYAHRDGFFIIPCDGHFSRDVQKALLLAIQFELGMTDAEATGVFGLNTQAGLKANTLSVGSAGVWVRLFSAAMIFNKRNGVSFTSTFDGDLSARASEFQDFAKLPVTGEGDFQTWASLLVSTGDPTREGTALDCAKEVTAPRADALKAAGYRIVGRYLCNVAGTSLNKMIQPGELAVLAAKGFRVFPIYQTWGGAAGYFSYAQGVADAFAAIEWAGAHGFLAGTRIYFAVDFDALDHQVTSNVIPHFRGIKETISEHAGQYQIGIYGPRNVCSRVAGEGLSSASFVSGMSTGYSGNLGYPLPADWAFDQISTITVGSGSGLIEIDNDIASGRDPGQGAFGPGELAADLDVDFDMTRRDALLVDVQTYLTGIGVPEEGGGDLFDTDQATLGFNTTTESLDITLAYDGLITSLARRLKMRKALIQCPILWEIRKINLLDGVADDMVRNYYNNGVVGRNDCSTGLAQIFAATAINARNHAIQQGIIDGTILGLGHEPDLWSVWQKLQDPYYTISTVGYVHIWGAADIGVPRPGLSTSEEHTRRILARFNGTGPDADSYGYELLGLYKVFEKYHASLRSP